MVEPVISTARKQGILITNQPAINKGSRFIINIKRFTKSLIPAISIFYCNILKTDIFRLATNSHYRTSTGSNRSTNRCKLIKACSFTGASVIAIVIIILNTYRCIISRVTFNGNIALVAQVNNFLIDTVVHLEHFPCSQINMSSTKINSSLQRIKISIYISMAYLHIIFSPGKCRSSLRLETPCTTIDTRKIFLNDGIPVNDYIIFRIKFQTLLMRFDNEIIPFRIIVYYSAISGRTGRSRPDGIHPSIQIALTCIVFICGKWVSSFSHINLIHHLMVAHPINADVSACTQLRRYTVERDFQFRIGKSISCFIGWKEMVLGRLIPIRRTVFIAAVFPRSGAVSCIHIFQTAYDNIFRRIDINSERILRTGIEFRQTDIKVGKHPFACSAVQNKRNLVSIT